MENEEEYYPAGHPRALLREEIRILAKRVDALIEWTEKFGKMMLIFHFFIKWS